MNQKMKMMAQLMRGRNPQEIAMQLMQNVQDPTLTQLVQYAQQGNTNDFTKLAQNYFQQHGVDLNKELADFMELIK